MTATLTRTLAFTVGAKEFASAVGWAAKRVPTRPTVPMLGGILLAVEGGMLTASGFDYDASASARVPVDAGHDGRVLVSGRLLAGLLGTFPDKPIQGVASNKLLTLTCGRVEVTLPLMPVAEYPELPRLPQPVGEVDTAVLAEAVRLVGSSCDLTGEANADEFTGINLVFSAEAVGIEASNRSRGGQADIPWRSTDPDVVGKIALAAGSQLLDVVSNMAAHGETTTVCRSDELLGLSTPNRSVVMRLKASVFPPRFRRLFPPVSDWPARIDVVELKQAVDRVRLLGGEVPLVSLLFSFGEVVVRGADQASTAVEPIRCAYDGTQINLVLSVRHLLGSLSAAGGPVIDFSIVGDDKPVVLTPVTNTPAEWSYVQLIMPVIGLGS